ncbi:MAG: hypothetical protein KKH60_07440, partial [Proteobacteria bacterium]|nr:hypothetical protein [Pseudomonadota bacterium]
RGDIRQDMAPQLPLLPRPADLVLLLDMLHYLDDETITTLFANCFEALTHGGILVIRFVIHPDLPPSKSWMLEHYRIKFSGGTPWYRSSEKMAELMRKAGFIVERNMVSQSNPELVWIIGRAEKDETSNK